MKISRVLPTVVRIQARTSPTTHCFCYSSNATMLKYFKPVGSEVAASKRTRDDAPIASVSSSSSPIVLASAGAGSGLSANREASDVAAAEVAILEEQAAAGNPSAQDQLDILKTSKPASTTGAQASGADAEWRSKLAKLHESISAGSSSAASAAGSLGAAAGQGAASLSATDAAEALSALGISVHSSWAPTVLAEAKKPYFKQLEAHLLSERGKHGDHRIFPAHANVYSALALTPLDQIKVVILGQDPYHGPGQAHGLAFSVPKGVAVPPSLVNILKEVEADVGCKRAGNGNLEYWARQGVLLLNAVLTVRQSEPNSHQNKGWEQFTGAILKAVAERKEKVVFLLWGKPAQDRGKSISRSKHCVLEAPHPSPLSAHRGFLGCKHFSKANAYLKDHGLGEIDWCLEGPMQASASSTSAAAAAT